MDAKIKNQESDKNNVRFLFFRKQPLWTRKNDTAKRGFRIAVEIEKVKRESITYMYVLDCVHAILLHRKKRIPSNTEATKAYA
jgi:hypothetical protein